MSCIGRLVIRYSTAALTLVFTTAQIAAAPIGEATAAKNDVRGQLGPVAQQISVGSNVSSDEIVTTGSASSTELRFLDTSTLTIGAGSVVELDRHIYDPRQGSVDTFVNLSKGALRFISAGQRTKNVTMATPVATIGIRGSTAIIDCSTLPCKVGMITGSARVCPFPEGTPVTQQLKNACREGNETGLPCGFYDITAQDEQQSDDEKNFIAIGANCSIVAYQNVGTQSLSFAGQQIAAGGVLPGVGIYTAATWAITPLVPAVAMTTFGVLAVTLPEINETEFPDKPVSLF